jgi:hypothetical protein
MEQGPDLSELRQRIEAVGERFSEMTEDSRQRGERLADLLDEVESGFVRDRLELDRLKQALAKAQQEKTQILALLDKLLAVAEHVNGLGERAALYDVEARVDRLYEQVAMPEGAGALESDQPEEAARNAGPRDGESEDPRWEKIPEEDNEVEDGDPLDLTSMLGETGGRVGLGRAAARASLVDGGAVQDIFKRVSMITGRLRET